MIHHHWWQLPLKTSHRNQRLSSCGRISSNVLTVTFWSSTTTIVAVYMQFSSLFPFTAMVLTKRRDKLTHQTTHSSANKPEMLDIVKYHSPSILKLITALIQTFTKQHAKNSRYELPGSVDIRHLQFKSPMRKSRSTVWIGFQSARIVKKPLAKRNRMGMLHCNLTTNYVNRN